MRRVPRMVFGVTAFVFVVGVATSDASTQGKGDPQPGKATYEARCAICHGASGAGDGPAAKGLEDKPSNWNADGGRLKDLEDQKIFELIVKGGRALGKSAAMPAHLDLSESEVWNLVAYVESLVRGGGGEPVRELVSTAKIGLAESETLRWGSALEWAITLTIVLSALILAGILVSLIVYRGRQTEGNALWLHLLSLGVFPLLLLAVDNFAVLEYAKEVRFCGSCHRTMKPYIDDLHNLKSQSLAALHFQHRFAPGSECYSCHANYGVHGTFEAKLTGLQDVYTYISKTYHLPLKMRAPFENALCLKCHNGAKRYIAQEVHLKLAKVIEDGKLPCASCHRRAHDIRKPAEAASLGGAG